MGDDNNDNNNNNNEYWTCCNDDQTLFILFYISFSIIAIITMGTYIAKPIRLIGTFFHEMSHAIACWITCGTVHKIHVYHNEGGITQYNGGIRCIIIPAGYIGCSIWSTLFVIMSGGVKSATFGSILFIIVLLISLLYKPNRTMIYLIIMYTLLILLLIYIEWYKETWPPMMQFIILFFGVYLSWISIYDIYRDTICRIVERSDSYACHTEVCCNNKYCCSSQCIGIQWILIAILFQWFGIWIALVQMSNVCIELSWISCMTLASSIDNENNIFEYLKHFFEDIGQNFEFNGFFNN